MTRRTNDLFEYLGDRCVVCGSTEKVEHHHVIPQIHQRGTHVKNDDTIPLCSYHHQMMSPIIHSVLSPFYPIREAEKAVKTLNKKMKRHGINYSAKLVIGEFSEKREGKLIQLKNKQYCIEFSIASGGE
jgi:hypothetical protein